MTDRTHWMLWNEVRRALGELRAGDRYGAIRTLEGVVLAEQFVEYYRHRDPATVRMAAVLRSLMWELTPEGRLQWEREYGLWREPLNAYGAPYTEPMPTAQSHHLQNYEYDADSQTLTVSFANGSVYQYPGVAFDDYNRLLQAGGSGTVFWAFIRDKYSGVKLSGGPGRIR